MLISYHYIDSAMWGRLPKETQNILKNHYYRPSNRIEGGVTITDIIDESGKVIQVDDLEKVQIEP